MVHYCNKQSLIPADTQVSGEISLLLNDVKYSLSYRIFNDAQRRGIGDGREIDLKQGISTKCNEYDLG